MRTTRSAMLEVLGQDYIRTARGKGLRPRAVIFGHAVRNALIPIVTLAGVELGYLLGGAVIVEKIFALPGIGRLTLNAISQRDYALIQGATLFIAFNFVVINMLVDVLYAAIDPRISMPARSDTLGEFAKEPSVLRRLLRSRERCARPGLVTFYITVAVPGPAADHAPFTHRAAPRRPAAMRPSSQYYLGTDMFGRDMLSRLIKGSTNSLYVAFFCVAISGTLGT